MDSRVTIGVIAKEAGIPEKSLRIYETKGLLMPVGYSEGGYRLYDENAKVTLEKILIFKYMGYSLDEIKELLEHDKDEDIMKSLSMQKMLLEEKRKELDSLVICVDKAITNCLEQNIQFKDFSDIMKLIVRDRKADESPECREVFN